MKKLLLTSVICVFVVAQGIYQDKIRDVVDKITYNWDTEAEKLSSYEGLTEFCLDQTYRYATIDILKDIHHYDSLLYKKLVKAKRTSHNHEITQTMKEIEVFEEKYTTKNFVHFLKGDCDARKNIEEKSEALRKDSGEGSYDGQVYVLEVELGRYVHHITKRVDNIREHVHHLF